LVIPADTKRQLTGGDDRRSNRLGDWLSRVVLTLVIAATAFVCWHAFEVDWPRLVDGSALDLNNPHPAVRVAFTRDQWAAFLHLLTPLSIAFGGAFFVINALRDVGQAIVASLSITNGDQRDTGNERRSSQKPAPKPKRSWGRLLCSTVCGLWRVARAVALVAVLSGLFLATLVPYTRSADKATLSQLPDIARICYAHTQPWLVTHSYGLFAR
jgi:hypothetical protein